MAERAVERRKYQRIVVLEPIIARFGANRVLINDLAVNGASIESTAQLKAGEQNRLVFNWDGESVSMDARVVRCRLRGFSEEGKTTVYLSGVLFVQPGEESTHLLRRVISTYVSRALVEQKANARGVPMSEVENSDRELTGSGLQEFSELLRSRTYTAESAFKKSAGFVSFIFDKGMWKKKKTLDPTQPIQGFTISEDDALGQEELLCKTYEQVGEEWRKMIRVFAELSLAERDSVIARRFAP